MAILEVLIRLQVQTYNCISDIAFEENISSSCYKFFCTLSSTRIFVTCVKIKNLSDSSSRSLDFLDCSIFRPIFILYDNYNDNYKMKGIYYVRGFFCQRVIQYFVDQFLDLGFLTTYRFALMFPIISFYFNFIILNL